MATRTAGPSEAVGLFTRQVESVGEAIHAWLTSTVRYPLLFVLLLAFILTVNFWLAPPS